MGLFKKSSPKEVFITSYNGVVEFNLKSNSNARGAESYSCAPARGRKTFEKSIYPGKFLKITTLGKFWRRVTMGKFLEKNSPGEEIFVFL
jgi:hypothetical protein